MPVLVPSDVWRKREEMPHPLYPCGKRGHQALIAASSPGESARSRVLFIHERNSGTRVMIDSVADVILPICGYPGPLWSILLFNIIIFYYLQQT